MTLSCKTPTRILLRAQKQQLCLRGHLNPRVFYCLVTEPSGLIPVKHSNQDKINEPGVCSLCPFQDVNEETLKTSVCRT